MLKKEESVVTIFFMVCSAFSILTLAVGQLNKEIPKCTGYEVMLDSPEYIL